VDKRQEEAMITFATMAAGNKQETSPFSQLPREIFHEIAGYIIPKHMKKVMTKMINTAYDHHANAESQNQGDNSAILFGRKRNVTEKRRNHDKSCSIL